MLTGLDGRSGPVSTICSFRCRVSSPFWLMSPRCGCDGDLQNVDTVRYLPYSLGKPWVSQVCSLHESPYLIQSLVSSVYFVWLRSETNLVKMKMPPSSLLRTLFLVSAVAGSAIAELTFVATARQGDREIPSSELEFVRTAPRRHQRNFHGEPSQTETETVELGKRDITAYGPSWCGASQQLASPEQLSSVYGVFSVPNLKLRAGLSAPQNAAAWVGVDGGSCNRALLQAGVTTLVSEKRGEPPLLFFFCRCLFPSSCWSLLQF